MKTLSNLDEFENLVNLRRYEVSMPRGAAGYMVAYDHRGRAVARIFVYCC